MKNIIYFGLIFAILFSCKDSTINPINNSECIPLKTGNYWVYDVTDSLGTHTEETDLVTGTVNMELHGQTISAYALKTTAGSNNYTWYLYPNGDTTWFSSTAIVMPLVNDPTFPRNTFWLNLSFCNNKSFISENDSLFENIQVLVGGNLVNGRFMHNISLNCTFSGTENMAIKGTNYTASVYNCVYTTKESLIEPINATFADFTRVRNLHQTNLKIWYASGVGFLRIEQDGGRVRQLNNYSFLP